MDIFANQIFTTIINIHPSAISSKINSVIEKKIKKKLGNKCHPKPINGYIKESSIEIINKSRGKISGNHFNGDVTFKIQFKCQIATPIKGKKMSFFVSSVDSMTGIVAHIPYIRFSAMIPAESEYISKSVLKNITEGNSILVKIIDFKLAPPINGKPSQYWIIGRFSSADNPKLSLEKVSDPDATFTNYDITDYMNPKILKELSTLTTNKSRDNYNYHYRLLQNNYADFKASDYSYFQWLETLNENKNIVKQDKSLNIMILSDLTASYEAVNKFRDNGLTKLDEENDKNEDYYFNNNKAIIENGEIINNDTILADNTVINLLLTDIKYINQALERKPVNLILKIDDDIDAKIFDFLKTLSYMYSSVRLYSPKTSYKPLFFVICDNLIKEILDPSELNVTEEFVLPIIQFNNAIHQNYINLEKEAYRNRNSSVETQVNLASSNNVNIEVLLQELSIESDFFNAVKSLSKENYVELYTLKENGESEDSIREKITNMLNDENIDNVNYIFNLIIN